jgi:hypothetical protein
MRAQSWTGRVRHGAGMAARAAAFVDWNPRVSGEGR